MNQFTERYKTLSNSALLKIIDNPGDYQPLAVEAANEELAARQLSEAELTSANAKNAVEIQDRQFKIDKKNAFENKIKDIGSSIIDTIHPIQKTKPTVNRIITILSIGFSLLFVMELFNEFSFLKFMLTSKYAVWGFEAVLIWLELLLIPIVTFLFWRRRKSGWILFCVYACYSLAGIMGLVLVAFGHRPHFGGFETLFRVISPKSLIENMFFFGGSLWLICRNDIREIYNIDARTMIIVGGLTVSITAGIIWGSMH